METPTVFVFAPADEKGKNHAKLERYGCKLLLGEADWHTPQGNNEKEMIDLAKGAVALLGTSIRSSPITRSILKANPNLFYAYRFP